MSKSPNNLLKSYFNKGWFQTIVQFIKFGVVGISNTAISYGIEMLMFYVVFVKTEFLWICSVLSSIGINTTGETVKIVITTAVAFVISVTNSYYWNNRYVFKSGNSSFKAHLKSYIKTFLCYAVTGLVLSPIIKVLLNNIGVDYWLATLSTLVATIPLNFLMNKFWAFKHGK